MAAGVIEETIKALPVAPEDLVAEIGPCISADQYEVGRHVLQALSIFAAEGYFREVNSNKQTFNLDLLRISYNFLRAREVAKIGEVVMDRKSTQIFSHRCGDCGGVAAKIAMKGTLISYATRETMRELQF